MAANRPQGKRERTARGSDAVAGEPAPEERAAAPEDSPGDRAERAARDDRPRADANRLDERERRQSASRKPPGPRERRLTEDDVVIDTECGDDPPPTDPR